jgi:hypothetical protein
MSLTDSSAWTLAIGSTTKTLAAWGLTGCVLKLASFAADTFTCSWVPLDLSAAPLFAEDTDVALYRDGTCVFRGTSHNPRLHCSGGTWRWQFTCSNAWWDLDQLVLQQQWTTVDSSADTLISADSAQIVFGMWYTTGTTELGDTTYTLHTIDTAEMIEQTLDYAIECGVEIARGTILSGIDCPAWSAQDISVAAALKAICKWHPTAVTWWDYSAEVPILNIQLAALLGSASIDCEDASVQDIDLTPRHDLVVEGCIVRYVRNKTITEAKVATTTGINVGYWSVDGGTGLSVWTVESTHYKWVGLAYAIRAGLAYSETREREVNYVTSYTAGAAIDSTTRSSPGVLIYSVPWSSDDATPPADAAEKIYQESGSLQYAGQIILMDDECPMYASTGQQLALANGPTLAGTAAISGVSYAIDAGMTTLTIGPWGTLGKDWVDLLARRITEPSSVASDNSLTSGGATDTPETTDTTDDLTWVVSWFVDDDGPRQVWIPMSETNPTQSDT